MLPNRSSRRSARRDDARLFAALGDETRLALVARLATGEPCSISRLTEGSRLTRQAITKHLRVLKRAGMVENVRRGRQNVFVFRPQRMQSIQEYLDFVSQQWDQALARLQAFVEEPN